MQDLAAIKEAGGGIDRREDSRFAWLECAVLNMFRKEDFLTAQRLMRDRPYG